MNRLNLEDARKILEPIEGSNDFSDDELTEQLSTDITFQIAFDNGNVVPVFKMPFYAILELWQTIGLKDTEEYTSEDAAEIGKLFKDLIDDGTVDYDI